MRDRRAAKSRRSCRGCCSARCSPSAAATANAVDIKIATVAPDGSRWMQQMRAGAEEVSTRTGGRVDDQVLSRRRHGQRRAGAAQDPHRPAARRRVHGRRARRALRRAEPVRHPAAVPLARRDRCRARAARSRARGGSRAGGFRDASASSKAGSRICSSNEPIRSVEDMRRKKVWVPEGDADQLPRHGGAGLVAVRAARDRRVDGAANGAHRDHVRVARRGARAAVAHEGQIHHGAADLVLDGHLRDREGRLLGAQRRRTSRSSARSWAATSSGLDREARDDNRKRGRGAREIRPADGRRSTTRTSRVGAARSRAFIRSCARAPTSMPRCSTGCSALLAEYRRTHP